MISDVATDATEDEWLIYDDDGGGMSTDRSLEDGPWRILIVDDDLDVHAVTRLALHNLKFKGRPLKFLSAYSSEEGFSILRDTPDIALVLLDVVMESDDAGLLLARRIRDELDNQVVRVVLRTGQPGQAPEHQVVIEYDINDYKSKTELTAQKLFTTVVSSLRAFESLRMAERGRLELAASLVKIRSLKQALDDHSLLTITDQFGKITYANEKFCEISGYSIEELLGQDHRILNSNFHPKDFFADMWRTIGQGQTWQGEMRDRARDGSMYWIESTIVPFLNSTGQPIQYVAIHNDITQRKLAQERLNTSEAQLLGLLGISPGAACLVQDGQVVFRNPAFSRLFGAGPGGKEDCPVAQLFKDPQVVLAAAGQGTSQVVGILGPEGRDMSALASFAPVTYHGKPALAGWFTEAA